MSKHSIIHEMTVVHKRSITRKKRHLEFLRTFSPHDTR